MPDSKLEELEEHQLEDYIRKELKDGFSADAIKKALIDAGHPKQFVEITLQKIRSESLGKKIAPDVKNPIKLDKKKIIIAVILVLLIGAVALFLTTKPKPAKEVQQEQIIVTEGVYAGATQQDIDSAKKAAENSNVKYCSGIKNHNLYFDCIERIWQKDKTCRFNELIEKGDNCLFDLALKNKDIASCIMIKDTKKHQNCMESLFEIMDSTSCARTTPCMIYRFSKEKSADICALAESADGRDLCYFLFMNQYNKTDIKKYCYAINDTKLTERCIVERLPLQESKSLVSEESFYKTGLSRISSQEFEAENCNLFDKKIGDVELLGASKETKERLENLFRISEIPFSDYCFFYRAVRDNRSDMCSRIKDILFNQVCTSMLTNKCDRVDQKIYNVCISIINNCSTQDMNADVVCNDIKGSLK